MASTYQSLKIEIADYLDRDDLTSRIDDFIDLAEARHRREVRIREMLSRSSITVDDRYVSLPSDFLQMRELRLLTSPVTVLSQVSNHEITRIRRESTGKPEFFTIHAEIEFDKSPDQSYSGEILYYQKPPALESLQATNVILDAHPDLYLYGSLVAAEPFLQNDERLPTWVRLYEQARDQANALAVKQRHAGGPLVSRIVGTVN